eukprot:GGOE01037023.1.p1 GENE.GGOE01037023.1~~GGOE01037023.1.p1  ORF type:complete len:361 (+),score=103.59 GGOE01037023.1:85-1167(+)
MVDYSKWNNIVDEDDDPVPPRPPQAPVLPSFPPAAVQRLQAFLNAHSRLTEISPTTFEWELSAMHQLRPLCAEAGQATIYGRFATTPHHSCFALVLRIQPFGFFVEDQTAVLPSFLVRFSRRNAQLLLNVHIKAETPGRNVMGFDAGAIQGLPNLLDAASTPPENHLIIWVAFERAPGNAPTAQTASTKPAAQAGGTAPKAATPAKAPLREVDRNQLVAAVVVFTAYCLLRSQALNGRIPSENPRDVSSRVECLLRKVDLLKRGNEYRLQRLEQQLDRIERTYAPPPNRGKQLEEKADPLSALRQSFKACLHQLDALERQQGHLRTALEQQSRELASLRSSTLSQNDLLQGELAAILEDL